MSKFDGVSMKKYIHKNKFYLLFFLAVTVIAFFFPPSADDLGWATSGGEQLLKNGFENYNGRYLGNIFAVVLTRIPYALPFIKGFVLTSILYFIQKITSNKSKEFLYLSAVLLLLPTPLWIQGFVWTAGFSNYSVSALVIMLNLYLVFYKRDKKWFHILLIFISGMSGQLYMETFTLFSLVMSVYSIVYFCVINRKPDAASVTYFLSCLIGAVIMFSNGVYLKILNGENTYQSLSEQSGSFLKTLIGWFENLFGTVSFNALISCFPAIIAVTILSLSALKKSENVSRKTKLFAGAFFFLSVLSAAASGVVFYKTRQIEENNIFVGVLLLCVVTTCALIIFSCLEKPKQERVAVYFLMILFFSVPLCAVNPVGPRCFTGAYILLIIIIKELMPTLNKETLSKVLKISLAVVLAVNLFCYTQVYFANMRKVELIKDEVSKGNTVVELKKTRFGFMVYALDVEYKNEKFKKRFCEYYGLPEEIKIIYK